ncbi:LysR family transcriptional regulator [Kitasatospora brasiliensis]|uniref:LysR family transcriptional regulator n=1 Tax=Kitasatospora brasiliensis TaxID=3058040 RepID=UPI00293032B3|nr:LysR family transcriptional regulator [Kitasatospora sp. K002]
MTDRLDFSLTQLRYFVESAELGNISEAAEKLRASQSTVSSAIMRLERQLGVQLLLRHHARGVSLTPNGRHLLLGARALLGQARDLQEQGDALAGNIEGRLGIGFLTALAPFLLPPTHRITAQRHAGLRLSTHEERADPLLALLLEGQCELAVTYDFLSGGCRFLPLAELRLQALLPDDPGSSRDDGPVPLARLADRPLVALDDPPLLLHFEKCFADAGVPLPPVITAAGPETVRGLVAAGCGFALSYQRTHRPATLDGGRIRAVQLDGPAPTAALGVATAPSLALGRRGRAVLNVLRSVVSTGRP